MDLSQLPGTVRAVFSDLDDTLTDDSLMRDATYGALWDLHRAGIKLILVSGRPAGWADCLMRLWPLDAMIFENGAGYLWREGDHIRLQTLADIALENQVAMLSAVFQKVKAEIPAAKLATDQPFRLCDFAIDFAEEPPFLTEAQTQRALEIVQGETGITAKLSSIHINYWLGTHTKVTACETLFEHLGKSLGIDPDSSVFLGDSPNDEPLFYFFQHSIGVANVKNFLGRMKHHPKYVTRSSSGAGFQEVVKKILAR